MHLQRLMLPRKIEKLRHIRIDMFEPIDSYEPFLEEHYTPERPPGLQKYYFPEKVDDMAGNVVSVVQDKPFADVKLPRSYWGNRTLIASAGLGVIIGVLLSAGIDEAFLFFIYDI